VSDIEQRMSAQLVKRRMIFKVIILGGDISLQTGFLCRASDNNVSTQLFGTLGVSLGVARSEENQEALVAIQLWALPLIERLSGLTANFVRGHRGVIIVVRPEEFDSIPNLLKSFSIKSESNLVITAVRSDENTELDLNYLNSILDDYKTYDTRSVSEIIEVMTEHLLSKREPSEPAIVYFLNEEDCPIFEAPEIHRRESTSPDEDVAEMKTLLLDQGLRVLEESCIVELEEGAAMISLRTGTVSFEPVVCDLCLNDCKRKNNICIIAVDPGWSSQGVGQKALLTTAKAIALAERSLPNHVEMQIQRASRCSRFILDSTIEEQDVPTFVTDSINENVHFDRSLLEIAKERLNQGKLSISAFNMLKSRFEKVKQSLTD